MEEKLNALLASVSAQDSVISSLVAFTNGLPDLINTAVAAKEAGDESAIDKLNDHIKANTQQIANAVANGTSAAAPESGNNDDPVTAAAARANAAPAVTTEPAAATDADAKDDAETGELTETNATADNAHADDVLLHYTGSNPTTHAANGDIVPLVPADDATAAAIEPNAVDVDADHQVVGEAAAPAADEHADAENK